ncbi:MAG: AAA family ATPase [Patescibacteria group bacterium]|nr:AAA family ATPase [Patescibacteria group bacterium]
MYLEKLEVQGFKSFANKNLLRFPGMMDKIKRGITAVVGPNGSGKSNVADAVRWALGEQSMKTLRGKKGEDVIFSGSDKKGQLGMAEVSLFLNNEDKQAPVDYSKIIITRRLFRNGESEYMINNNRARLSDIQMLLAKSKFGQKTYSVIGQGMVEGFLNTSLSERKEFFDEATGVKQYQIKRDDSLNKLRNSYENLVQAKMLISEIEPRLKSLTRQVNKLKKRNEIEKELKEKQTVYYRVLWQGINQKFTKHNNEFLELEKIKFDKEKKLERLNRQLNELEKTSQETRELPINQEKLAKIQQEKNTLNTRLAKLEAQTEIKLEASGQFDLSFLISRQSDLDKKITKISEEINDQNASINISREKTKELERSRETINKKIKTLNEQLRHSNKDNKNFSNLHQRLNQVVKNLNAVHKYEDINKLKNSIKKIEKEISELLLLAESLGIGQEELIDFSEIQVATEKAAIEKDEILSRIKKNDLRITAISERVKFLNEKIIEFKTEKAKIKEKINRQDKAIDMNEIQKKQNALHKKIEQINNKEQTIKIKIKELNREDENARNNLFKIQRELSAMQQEINTVNNKLNEIKINSTRYEAKLENLEEEIREELDSLKNIKNSKITDEIDEDAHKDKINSLKRQLEMIGGIDPEIENEYNETKERFDFLSGQINDFGAAIDSLQKIIKELDGSIKERFDKEFNKIATNFEKYFKILFKGGGAKIAKVMETMKDKDNKNKIESEDTEKKEDANLDDLKKIKFLQKHNATGLAGVEIQATPPGKKIKTVTMLSGGERALTAIALICAIISSNPSPFVVLDEVDAALDEANSERLASILDELSHKTQFIVITHNRASMRKANILYGITMGNNGVSKLLSIKLDEAKDVSKT